ncbi:MAG TPA: electron transfer flavoprotein subunit alpha/FixB family protein [Candidatus Bathyarchaeia archaeon]|nr:electron transfer flavoprotein subunit alpha/FixB family protein [Candidatus Bathyarchaeia archaeon]
MQEENHGVWIFSEVPKLAFELLGKGSLLAKALGSELVAISIGPAEGNEDYIKHGADKVLTANDPALANFHVDTYTDALSELATEHNPDIILIGATRNGLELAPRLAERLKTGCVTEATRIEPDADKRYLLMDRITLGGNLVETHVSRVKPQIATVARGLFSALPADDSRKGQVVKVEPKIKDPSTKLLEKMPKGAKGVRLADASVIVSFGRGIREKKDIIMVEKLANAVGGVIGCSRPIAEDLHWLPEEQYIGLSGQKVSPKLYFACGISGQIQHLTGIRNSKIIISVNNDPKAPILEFTDYAIVADLYQILPVLTETMRQLRKG